MMARTLWTGFVSFGLVSVPVGLYPVVEDQAPRLNQLNAATSNRVRYQKVDEVTGEVVESTDIVKGFDTGDGQYVLITDEELKDVAPGKSETIEISDFVDLISIDPVHFRQAYYLAPRGKGAERAYSLLRQAMRESGKIAIATFVLRDKEHLVAIRPGDDVLVLETMYFPAEIRDPSTELSTLPELVESEPAELDVAKRLIESLTIEWQPERYENESLKRIEALLASKHGASVKVARLEAAPSTASVVDLMSALAASVARTNDMGAATAAAPRPGGTTIDLTVMTKTQLQRLASDYNVAGRTKLSKADLVEALTQAGATNPQQRATA
jgi:DNA end-binding protein Ku